MVILKKFYLFKNLPLNSFLSELNKGTSFSGEFISIQKVEILKYSPWRNVSGYEAIRHWKINKYYDYLLYSNQLEFIIGIEKII